MERLWKLMKAAFTVLVSVTLFVVGWLFTDGRFDGLFPALLLYCSLGGILVGIVDGLIVICKKEDKAEQGRHP